MRSLTPGITARRAPSQASKRGARGQRRPQTRIPTMVPVCNEVFRDLLNEIPYLSPPPPPSLLGFGRFGVHDYPPSTYLMRGEECG
jgi:hypothetical protein